MFQRVSSCFSSRLMSVGRQGSIGVVRCRISDCNWLGGDLICCCSQSLIVLSSMKTISRLLITFLSTKSLSRIHLHITLVRYMACTCCQTLISNLLPHEHKPYIKIPSDAGKTHFDLSAPSMGHHHQLALREIYLLDKQSSSLP